MKRLLVLTAVLTVLAACSSGPPVVTSKTVSQEAESQLRKQNPEITAGTMKCPELAGEIGRKVRCVRSAHIGIWDVTLKGTVAVALAVASISSGTARAATRMSLTNGITGEGALTIPVDDFGVSHPVAPPRARQEVRRVRHRLRR